MIGARLKLIRTKAKISTKELDRLSGLQPGHTWAVENSKSGNADTKTLDRLAIALGVSLDYLVRGEGPEPTTGDLEAAVATARSRHAAKKPTGTED